MATRAERQPTARFRRTPRWRPAQQSEAYLFLLPSFLGFLIFVIGPVLGSLALSFADWNLLSPPRFVGFDNYVELLTRDPVFTRAFWNTIYFTITIVRRQSDKGRTGVRSAGRRGS